MTVAGGILATFAVLAAGNFVVAFILRRAARRLVDHCPRTAELLNSTFQPGGE